MQPGQHQRVPGGQYRPPPGSGDQQRLGRCRGPDVINDEQHPPPVERLAQRGPSVDLSAETAFQTQQAGQPDLDRHRIGILTEHDPVDAVGEGPADRGIPGKSGGQDGLAHPAHPLHAHRIGGGTSGTGTAVAEHKGAQRVELGRPGEMVDRQLGHAVQRARRIRGNGRLGTGHARGDGGTGRRPVRERRQAEEIGCPLSEIGQRGGQVAGPLR